jgi:prepilin-type N-terminal cleavage/methylation domain-containing protein
MKKGFSLIELMIAIAVIFVGFSAVVAMVLSGISSSNSSKAKLKATSLAEGILETYRTTRDAGGIVALEEYLTPTPQIIDGATYLVSTNIHYIDSNSAIVETRVFWNDKTPSGKSSVSSYVLLTNYNDQPTVAPTYISYPTWYQTPTAH